MHTVQVQELIKSFERSAERLRQHGVAPEVHKMLKCVIEDLKALPNIEVLTNRAHDAIMAAPDGYEIRIADGNDCRLMSCTKRIEYVKVVAFEKPIRYDFFKCNITGKDIHPNTVARMIAYELLASDHAFCFFGRI